MGIVSSVSDALSNIGSGLSDTVSNVGEDIGQIGNNIDQNVNNLPGGWALPAAVAAMIVAPYAAPEIFSTLGGAEAGGTALAEGAGTVATDATAGGALAGATDAGVADAGVVDAGTLPVDVEPVDTTPTIDMSPSTPVENVSPELDPTSQMAQNATSPLQQAKDAFNALPTTVQSGLSGAGKGMATTAGVDLLTGKPITASQLGTSALVGGVGGALGSAVGSATDSTTLGKLAGTLGSVGVGSLLNGSSTPTQTSGISQTNATPISNASSLLSNTTPTTNTTSTSATPTVGTLFTGNPLKNTNILQQLKSMYPQLNQVSPQILEKLGYSAQSPLQTQSTQVAQNTQANPYENLLNQSEGGFKDGGHVPEFITGHTGHYADGKGDGQSDDIKALLNEGDYVMDAEAVAQLGNGSSKAGKSVLEQFRKSIPQNNHKVGGKVPAMIADGEYVLPSSFVSSLGKGDGNKGAEMLDKMRHALRDHKRSAPLNKIPPPAKSPLEYLKAGSKMKETR